jgi:Rho GTPase-activating protein 1
MTIILFTQFLRRENLKYEKSITMPTPTRSNLFGVPLEELMGYNGEKGGVPRVIKDAAHYLRDTGTTS